MTDLIKQLQQAETDAMAVTLQPAEISEVLSELDFWCRLYTSASEERDGLRALALDSLKPLRDAGYSDLSSQLEMAL